MLNDARRVHFVGIGGAGMSAIAKVLIERGITVTGSDLKRSRVGTTLEALGARISDGHDARNVEGADVVVISTAIRPDNPERRRAEEIGIPVILRGKALAALMEDARSVIVAGTHGKTTTTSMIVRAMLGTDLDPTYLIGAGLNDVGTNARAGKGDLWIAESDESDGSFLWLKPHVAVVTNIEMDHHDRWGSLDELRSAFDQFISAGDGDGCVVFGSTDEHLTELTERLGRRTVTFGDDGDVRASNIEPTADGGMTFDLHLGDEVGPVVLRVPGMHNVSNALAAAAACVAVGMSHDSIRQGLEAYRGVERRFQVRGTVGGVTVVDDYAHHPTEIRATLEAARSGPWDRVVAVFQPHRYSRTAAMWDEFGAAFEDADRIVVMDVYGAGEEPVPGVSGKLITNSIASRFPGRPVAYFPHRAEMHAYLDSIVRPGDVVLTLGAGDVTTVGDEFLARSEASE